MIRVTRFTVVGALVLALALGPIGCGGETSTPSKDSATKDWKAGEDYKKERMKRVMEEKQKAAAAAAAGAGADEKDKVKEDKPKSGDKDK